MQYTHSQKMAQQAFSAISQCKLTADLVSFARGFPSLVHSCGLAQSLAFAASKQQTTYLNMLVDVLDAASNEKLKTAAQLAESARTAPAAAYIRLSRHALQAAGWLKRYAEAVSDSDPQQGEG